MVAGGLFSCAYYGTIVHLVPILTSQGMGVTAAAGTASLAGLFAIIGRFGTGYLLDRGAPRRIAIVAFLLPAVSMILLLNTGGSFVATAAAVAILGLSCGAEVDILAFFASRMLAREIFGSVYGVLNAVIAVSAGVGPLIAGSVFDRSGSYDPFLLGIVPVALFCGALMAILPLNANTEEP